MNDTLDWHEYLVEQLAEREEALGFLHAVMEEYQRFGAPAIVMSAIETVVEAQGGLSALAAQTDVAPETFLNVLSSTEAHHCLCTLQTLLNTLGCRLSIEPLVQFETEEEEAAPVLEAPVVIKGRQPLPTEAVVAEHPRF